MIYIVSIVSIYLLLALFYFGRKRPEYSHLEHTISELAESGSSTEKQVSYLVFLPVGIAMAFVALMITSDDPGFFFAISLAIGYGAAAFFPIDSDAPVFGSWKNAIHNLSAGFSYLLAIAAFEDVGRDLGFPYTGGKFLVIAFIIILYIPSIRNYRGLFQRILEVAIFAGLLSVI